MSELASFSRELRAWGDFVYRVDRTFIGQIYSGNTYSRAAAQSENGTCINCGGHLILSEKGDFICEDCGEIVLYGYQAAYNRIYQKDGA